MRSIALLIAASAAVGFLIRPTAVPECRAATADTTTRTSVLPIYFGGTLPPVRVEGARQATARAATVTLRPRSAGSVSLQN